MTTKPASETPETDAAWQNFGQRSMRISGREITMVVRREDMRALERRLREAEQEILWDAEIIKSRDAQLEKWAAETAERRSEALPYSEHYAIRYDDGSWDTTIHMVEKFAQEWADNEMKTDPTIGRLTVVKIGFILATTSPTRSDNEVLKAAMRWYECLNTMPTVGLYSDYQKAFAALRAACERYAQENPPAPADS